MNEQSREGEIKIIPSIFVKQANDSKTRTKARDRNGATSNIFSLQRKLCIVLYFKCKLG